MKLYIKIFLSFLVTLIVAELIIFGIFRMFIQEDRHQRFHRLAEAQAVILREWIAFHHRSRDCNRPGLTYGGRSDDSVARVDLRRDGAAADRSDDEHVTEHETEHDDEIEHDRARDLPNAIANEEQRRRMQQAVERLSGLFRADVWVSDHNGRTLVRSFPGPVPPTPQYQQDFRNFSMGWGRRGEGFAKMPIPLPGDRQGRIFAHIPPEKRTPLESSFAWALGGLGLAFALLLIPISRMLTGPLKRLRHSAMQIAAGDLSHRVEVKGHDEIGELSQTFNNMADQIERMVRGSRELTAHVSHELRSPLARIRIAEELLRDNIDAGDRELAERRCDSIRTEIEDLDQLIGKILTLSRLEMQSAPPQREELRLQELAGDLLERYRPTLEKKRIELDAELDADAPAITAAPGELRTLLANLLDNAVKFTPEQGDIRFALKTISAQAAGADSAPEALLIQCENLAEPAPGMDLSRIFEPFYRKTTNGAGGTGLGLAITKKIVDIMQGEISVHRAGDRVRFEVRLPL